LRTILSLLLVAAVTLAACSGSKETGTQPPAASCGPSGTKSCKVLLVVGDQYYATQAERVPSQFREAGYTVVVASKSGAGVEACSSDGFMRVDLRLAEVRVADYDAVVYMGGYGCRDQWYDEDSHRVARDAVAEGKVLGAIGCGPTVLAHAGVLEGRQTAICRSRVPVKRGDDYCEIVESLGATCSDEPLVRDGRIVTAVPAWGAFAPAIIEVINER
jgi:protease I